MPGVRLYSPATLRAVAVAIAWALLVQPAVWAQMSPGGGGGGAPPPPPKPKATGPDFDTSGPQFRPTTPQPLIVQVRIAGNDSVTEAKIQSFLKTRVDREFDPEVLQADVRRLTQSGLFRDVRTYTQNVPQGLVVTLEVFERPTIRYLKFVGNRGMSDRQLKKQAGLKEGDALNIYEVEEGRGKIEEHYRSKGYPKTTVTVIEGDKPRDRGVVYMVDEGFLEKIWSVNFIGNSIASDGRLKTQIQSKPGYVFSLLGGKVEKKKIDEDIERLTAYYRGLGYFGAKIGRQFTYDDSGSWLSLTYVINEGPRYTVRNVSVVGNHKFQSEQLLPVLGLRSGDWFNQAVMNKDVQAINDIYGTQGHVFCDIKADPRFLEDSPELDLVYTIKEGEQYRVGRVNVHIEGESPHTRQNVVLNRISLRPGDIIDTRELRASETRLKRSTLFTNEPAQGTTPEIKVRPPGFDDPALADGKPSGPSKGRKFRGQSPDDGMPSIPGVRPTEFGFSVVDPRGLPPPPPGVRYVDVDVFLPPDTK